MERKIGEVFKINGIKVIVVEVGVKWNECDDCLFNSGKGCPPNEETAGDCLKDFREDRESVYFKKVYDRILEDEKE